jgi:hypothetical protein
LASLFAPYAARLNSQSLLYAARPTCLWFTGNRQAVPMFDLALLISGVALFALTVGYAVACDRL